MKPSIAVDITARDKTAAGRKSAEDGFGKFARKTSDQAKRSGLAKIGEQLDGLTKFRKVSFGFEDAGKSLAFIGRTSNQVANSLGSATAGATALGQAAGGAFGTMAEGATAAAGVVAGLATAVVGLGVGVVALGDKWSKTGAEVGRTAQTIGVTAEQLQVARAAGERFGVSTDTVTSSLDRLGTTLYDAKSGANNFALGALGQMGIQLKKTKDGAIDVYQAMLDISDVIARQKDPQVQRKIAESFGLGGMLPLLRQGSGAVKREGADYLKSGAALTDQEVAQSTDVAKRVVTAKQHMGAVEKTAGIAAEGLTGQAADAAIGGADQVRTAIQDPGGTAKRAVTALATSAKGLAHSGLEAGRQLVTGAKGASKEFLDGFEAFARRIEHRESGGRQFDKRGQPLTSQAAATGGSGGAVGVMQLIPSTAKAAAKRAGIPWDEHRYRWDENYNRAIGRAELAHVLELSQGHQVMAAAMYNAGVGRVLGYKDKKGRHHKGWVELFGDPRTGEISDEAWAAKIPTKGVFAQTHDYVAATAKPSGGGSAPASAAPAKAHVEIVLRGAPAGTTARVTGGPALNVDMHVARGMDGP